MLQSPVPHDTKVAINQSQNGKGHSRSSLHAQIVRKADH